MTSEFIDSINESIESLIQNSRSIASFLVRIRDISSQTTLLYVNASIQAAKAGDTVRGFTEVSNEIKKLANKSKEFSETIQNPITAVAESIYDQLLESTSRWGTELIERFFLPGEDAFGNAAKVCARLCVLHQ